MLLSTSRRRPRFERLLCLLFRPERRLWLRLFLLGDRLRSFLLRSFLFGDLDDLRDLRRRRGDSLFRFSFRFGERDLRLGERDLRLGERDLRFGEREMLIMGELSRLESLPRGLLESPLPRLPPPLGLPFGESSRSISIY